MRILIAEDDSIMAKYIKRAMEAEGFITDVCVDGRGTLAMIDYYPYSVLVLDLGLPDLDGISLLKTLRFLKKTIPVLIVSGRCHVDDRVHGLNCGADVFLAKPFAMKELMAYTHSLIWRNSNNPSPTIEIGGLLINKNSHRVFIHHDELKLTNLEYSLLEHLALHEGKIVSRFELTSSLYEFESDNNTNVIEVIINRIRNKILHFDPERVLHTIRGAGYCLESRLNIVKI